MANKQRYRSGPQKKVTGKIQGGQSTVAEIGDNVVLVNDYVLPISHFNDGQTASAEAVYLGVLIEGATTGDETDDVPCVVATTGVYEFDIAALAADKPPSTPVGPADGGSNLADQSVELTTYAEAIGKLAREALAGDTSVYVDIRSVVMDGAYTS